VVVSHIGYLNRTLLDVLGTTNEVAIGVYEELGSARRRHHSHSYQRVHAAKRESAKRD